MLISRPYTNSNPFNNDFMVLKFSQEDSPKINVSSVNCIILYETCSFTRKPLNKLFLIAFFIMPLRPSAAITNRKGESGPPYLNPLCNLKYLVGLPLTMTEMLLEKTPASIHLHHLEPNPNLLRMYLK